MGTPFAAVGQWSLGGKPHGIGGDRTTHAQREKPVARRPRREERTGLLLGCEQRQRAGAQSHSPCLHRGQRPGGGATHPRELQRKSVLRNPRGEGFPLWLLHHNGRTPHRHGARRGEDPQLRAHALGRFGLCHGKLHCGRRHALHPSRVYLLPRQCAGGALHRRPSRTAKPHPFLCAESLCRG